MYISYNVYAKNTKGEIIADFDTDYQPVAIAWGQEFKKMYAECQIIIVEHKSVTIDEYIHVSQHAL